jgi:hypothetical protein
MEYEETVEYTKIRAFLVAFDRQDLGSTMRLVPRDDIAEAGEMDSQTFTHVLGVIFAEETRCD